MTDNALWEYSLRVYQKPVVRDSLLQLQDGHGADVNVLLLACWLAHAGVRWSDEQLEAMVALSRHFNSEYLQAFRVLRRKLKSKAPQSIYIEAQRFELTLERWHQDALYLYWRERVRDSESGEFTAIAQANCQQYFRFLGAVPDRARDALLGELLEAVREAHREYAG